MPFVSNDITNSDTPRSRLVFFERSMRSKAERADLKRMAERDDLVAFALRWESVRDPVKDAD